MHIPENYLSPSTCGVLTAAMVPVWVHATRRVRETVPKNKMPLLGLAAAFSFLAMMFNVPIPGGTTGHAVCGTLIAILFGPWAATIALSVALALQAILFGDGGILAFGANCFNMAFILPQVGYGIYTWLMHRKKKGASSLRSELVAAGIASYVAINAAALCAGIEFGIQPLLFTDVAGNALYCPYPLWVSVPAMLAGHLTVAGAAEAIFTVGILAYVRKAAPSFGIEGLGATDKDASRSSRAMAALMCALIVLVPLGLLAEGDAWGEWAPEDVSAAVGYAPQGLSSGWMWEALIPDYSFGALPDWAGYVLSAVIGAAVLVIVFRLLAAGGKQKVDFGTR